MSDFDILKIKVGLRTRVTMLDRNALLGVCGALCARTYMCVWLCERELVCVYVIMCLYVRVCICVCMCVCVRAYVYVCVVV